MKWSKRSLNHKERNAVLKALRTSGVKPPRIGYCVRALGGSVCRHPPSKYLPGDTGYQTIEIDKPAGLAGYKRRRRRR